VTFDDDPVTLDGNGVASFIAGGVDVDDPATGFQVSTGTVSVAGGSHTVTVTLADGEGNPVSGQAAGLSASPTPGLGSGGITAFTESGTPGTYTPPVPSSSAGAKTITVFFGGDALSASGNAVAAFAAGAVDPGSAATGFQVSTGTVP